MVESNPTVKQFTYTRHKPEETTLYKLVQANWLGFQDQVIRDTGYPLPDFVTKEFEEYLRCGLLCHGFLRTQCESCHHEHLVAFSCKRRGFCPSCGGRRMSETAAHLVDAVLPINPIRQWVISFPFPIRLCLAVRPKIMAKALNITHTAISAYYRKKAKLPKSNAKTGAVTLIQRFGGSLNVNVHFHQLFVDGTYELGEQKEPVGFHFAKPPSVKEIDQVLNSIITRLTRYLERQKIIVKDEDDNFQLPIPEEDTFARLQASSITYRFATGPSKGKKAMVLKAPIDGDHNSNGGLVAKNSGFSLHAGVACHINERWKLEKICRYIARPAVAEERLSTNVRGEVIYRFKKPWDDGTAAIKLTPMEFMERLAALVPRPRVHLTRFHGVLAPHYKYRKQIVPKPKIETQLEVVTNCQRQTTNPKSISWAQLLKRVFNFDISACPRCGGKVRIISAIEDPKTIRKILDHLGIPSSPPRLRSGPAPPLSDQIDLFQQEFPRD